METAKAVHLNVEHYFEAEPQRVFDAWTKEEALRNWWQPMGNKLSSYECKLEDNGSVRYGFQTPEGDNAFTIEGKYDTVQIPERLSYTWNWKLPNPTIEDTDFHLLIEFRKQGNGTLLTVQQDQFSSEESVHPHREGWEKAFAALEGYLKKR